VDIGKAIAPIQSYVQQSLGGNADESVLAADLLANVGDAGARKVLIRIMESGDGPILAKAVLACVRDNMELGPALFPLAFGDGVLARRAVMEALVLHPDPRLKDLPLKGLNDADAAVRRSAIRALGNMSGAAPVEELAAKLRAPGTEKADILRALGAIGLRARDTLRDFAKRGPLPEQLDVPTLMALAPYAGRDDIPWVSKRLQSPSKYVRAAALTVLGRIGNPEAQAAVMSRIKDPEPLVRASAAKALGQIGTVYAAKELIAMLSDPSPVVVSMAAWGLGKAGCVEALPALIKLAKSQPTDEAAPFHVSELAGGPELVAIEALGRIGGPQAVAALKESLESPSWRVRATAAQALGAGRLGDSEPAAKALEKHLADPVNLVRAQALLSLKALGKTIRPDQPK
jgi:HEAT repeat protein